MIFKIFQNSPVVHGLSLAADGNMHLGFKDSKQNRDNFFKAQNIADKKIVAADLIHGSKVQTIDRGDDTGIIAKTDGLVTADINSVLTITVADCFPIYFYNPKENKIALAHSGWRGTVDNIAAKVVQTMNCKPEDILVGIGPGIQACHFEIKEGIIESFKDYPEAVIHRKQYIFIDLPGIIKRQLTDMGVKNIENSGECTYCSKNKYFSFRRDKPQHVKAMLAYIAKTG